MKFFVILAVTLSLVAAGDKEYHKLKKWAMHKAMEGCMGKEAAKIHMIQIKTAASKCMQMDAPELDLPMYKAPYRTVGALLDSAYNPTNTHNHPHGGMDHHHHVHGHDDNKDMFGDSMKKAFFNKMVAKMLAEEYFDDDESDSMDGPMRFFKSKKQNRRRYQRDTDSKKEMFELGDRLNAKLQGAKAKHEAEIGNFTCMLRECGVIDASNKLVSESELVAKLDEYPLPGDETEEKWLRSSLERDIKMCKMFAEAVPQEVLEGCMYGPELSKVKMFKKCMKMHKMRTCMNFDIKQQLEENFGGSLADLTETTQLEEDELLPLVMTLLHGPEGDM